MEDPIVTDSTVQGAPTATLTIPEQPWVPPWLGLYGQQVPGGLLPTDPALLAASGTPAGPFFPGAPQPAQETPSAAPSEQPTSQPLGAPGLAAAQPGPDPAGAPAQGPAMPGRPVGSPSSAPWLQPDVNPDAIVQAPPPWLAAAQHDASAPKLGAADYGLARQFGEPTSTGEDPVAALHKIAMDPQASVSERATAWSSLAPDEQTRLVLSADPHQLSQIATYAMPDEQRAAIAVRLEGVRQADDSARQLALSIANQERQRRIVEAYEAANKKTDADAAEVDAAARALANEKVDQSEHGVGFAIATALGGALGALAAHGAGLAGNPFMEGLKAGTEQRIANQKADIENQWKGIQLKRNLIAEQYQRSGDLFKAQEAYRLSQFDRAAADLKTQAQNFAVGGTTNLRAIEAERQIVVGRATALQNYADKQRKFHLEEAKAKLEADTLSQTVKHQNAETAIAYGHLNVDRSKDAREQKEFEIENAPVTPEQVKLENPGLPEAAYPTTPVTRKELKGRLETYGKGIELQGKTTENAQKQSAGQVLNGAGNPYLKDGKPVQIKPEVAQELNGRIAGGQAYLDEMSKVKRMLAADPSTFDRDKWSELNSHLETAAASWTQLYDAKASSRELEAAKEVVGANFQGYAARVKDKGTGIAAIGAQIESTKRNLNTQLKRRAGIQGGADLFDTSEPPPTKETPEDKSSKVLSSNYAKVAPDSLDADDRAFQQLTYGKNLDNPKLREGLVNEHFSPVVNRALAAGIAPAQLRVLDQLQAAARGSDPAAREKALEVLGGITGVNTDQDGKRASATGANANVRAAAQAIIDEASTDSMTSALNSVTPSGADELAPEDR